MGSSSIVRDISLRKQREQGIRSAKIRAKNAQEAAEQASRAKSEFLSSMSHELRTPLNAILGFAQLLQYNSREPLSESQESSVDNILKGGKYLLELIEQVLELSKIEAGKLSLNFDHIPAQVIIDESLKLIQMRADKEGIEVIDRTVGDVLPLVWVDGTRMVQVLLNLLSNAVKYNRANGTVTLSCLELAEQMLRISVTDTGPGIPVEKQDDLFKPFERLGREAGQIEGTGIGLTITRQIIELLGGRVGFESVYGKGSTFWVDVPISGNQEDVKKKPKAAGMADPITDRKVDDGPVRTVLYVEDNPQNMWLMENMIGRIANTKLLTAYNAELGLDLAISKTPDLILMDINLPGMNGLEALKQLQKITETKDIPVIAITAAAMHEEVEAGLKAGFKDYITKPINVPEFIRTIEKILDSINPR